ncbi:DUF945 family protein [Duganella sp. FT135W]|uniref:DUF945 family protein n=1 Tax=Duganella flavida TaxID=2692175 RepID=A0A6L8KFD2_9BURK|nr:DUF945 family protein [Duganella flavida]MYM25805.1 DUF945 family protein [Duganella flavida]
MKKTLLFITAASAMLAAPVYADTQPAAPAPKLPEFLTKETEATLNQAGKELRAAQGKERNFAKLLDTYSKLEFSPELRPKLKEIFGVERPFPLQRSAGAKGQINYVGKLAPHLFVQGNGTDFSWTELTSKITTDKAGRTLNANVTWPSLVVARPDGSARLLDMTITTRQQRGADGAAYGTANFGIGAITVHEAAVGGKTAKELMRFEDLQARSETVRRGSMAEIGYRSSVKAIVFGDERVERATFAFRLTNIPAKEMAELDQSLRAQENSDLALDARQEVMMLKLKDSGKRLIKAGAALTIEEISAAYRGNVASVKGRVAFQKVVDADFENMPALIKKLVAHFDVRVPVALVRDVGRATATKTIPADTPDAAKQIDAAGDGMVSMVVGKAVTSGFAVVEKGELRSSIDFKNGQLTVNGKVIELPNLNLKQKND